MTSRATTWAMIIVLGLFALAVLGVAGGAWMLACSSEGGGGLLAGGRPARHWPRMWHGRAPILANLNGDDARDIIGWTWQYIDGDMHQLLCAFDGRTGAELWCADAGEEDDTHDSQTALVGRHVVHFDARGNARAFAVRGGAAESWTANVRGQPEEVCALGADRVAVRTSDRLWSILTLATGAVALVGEARPEGCTWPRTTGREVGGYVRVHAPGWTRTRDRPPSPPLSVRASYVSSTSNEALLMGVSRAPTRAPPMIALHRDGVFAWEGIVPIDPILAEAEHPAAVAITPEVVYVAYALTARGDAPVHLTAFRMSDGQRLWDVGVPDDGANGPAQYLISNGDTLLLGVTDLLLAFDAETGRPRYYIGEPNPSRRRDAAARR